ncbi:MAG: oxygen-independent coproporphyrinogen-3 oxidase [Verrucomicrobiales bacterium]
MPIRHLYIHIPFCHKICPYCSFFKHQPGKTDQREFLECLVAEAQAARQRWPLELETIYFGGGTPSIISQAHLEWFLPKLIAALDVEPAALDEWTIEMNPMTFDSSKAELFRECGVTRASLGVQAWDSETLQTLGRDHSPAQAEESFLVLRDAGFSKVSLDLMFSIPGQSLATWEQTLQRTLSLDPDHISAYNLNYEEDTEFFDRLKQGIYRQDDEADVPFFESAMTMLGNAGYDQYEISNYAKAGSESAHNRGYWEGRDYIGLGPSAFSTHARERWQNVCSTEGYIKQIRARGKADLPAELLDENAWRCERLALELRTRRGVSEEVVGTERFGAIAELIEAGYIQNRDGRVILTDAGKMLADSVAGHLL